MDTRPRGWGWIGRLQASTFDRLLVGVLLLLGLTNAIVDLRFIEREPRFPLGGPGGMAIPFFVGLALLLVQVVPLLWRRRHPGLVLLFVAGAFAARVLLGFNPGIAGFGLLVAMYSVAAYEVAARRLFFLVVAGLGFVAGFVVFGVTGNPRSFAITVPSLFFVAAWLIAVSRRHVTFPPPERSAFPPRSSFSFPSPSGGGCSKFPPPLAGRVRVGRPLHRP